MNEVFRVFLDCPVRMERKVLRVRAVIEVVLVRKETRDLPVIRDLQDNLAFKD